MELESEAPGDVLRIAPFVAIGRPGGEVHAREFNSGGSKAGGDDRGIEAAGQLQEGFPGRYLTRDRRERGLAKQSLRFLGIEDCIAAGEEARGAPRPILVPFARLAGRAADSGEDLRDILEARASDAKEGKLQPVDREFHVGAGVAEEAEFCGKFRVRDEEILFAHPEMINRDASRRVAVDARLRSRSVEQRKIAPMGFNRGWRDPWRGAAVEEWLERRQPFSCG
jgi:hypothetical protein